MTRREAATALWVGSIGTMVIADVMLDGRAPECTLSQVGRGVFYVEHPVGEAVFVAAWAALSCWLIPHIIRPARRARAVLTDATTTKG